MLLRVSKNIAETSEDRAAGELEGARPASNPIARRPKRLENQGFSEMHFGFGKMLGGEAQPLTIAAVLLQVVRISF